MEKYYYLGHTIFHDGKWWCAHHGLATFRALRRADLEKTLAHLQKISYPVAECEYHAARIIDLLEQSFGTNPKSDSQNSALILAKKLIATIITIQTQENGKH